MKWIRYVAIHAVAGEPRDIPEAHLRLGEVYHKIGNRAKAIEHTEKFLEMWKDADPGLPEVDDTKKRLSGLKEKTHPS